MRKTDKKTENKIRIALTNVCDRALEDIAGYQWITHQVNYKAFPDSLLISCAFESEKSITALQSNGQDRLLRKMIQGQLAEVEVELKDSLRQVKFVVG